jgi:hypothetical protein
LLTITFYNDIGSRIVCKHCRHDNNNNKCCTLLCFTSNRSLVGILHDHSLHHSTTSYTPVYKQYNRYL